MIKPRDPYVHDVKGEGEEEALDLNESRNKDTRVDSQRDQDGNPLTQSAKMRVSYFNPVAGLGGGGGS